MALQFSRALGRLVSVPLMRSSAAGARLATTKVSDDDTIPSDMEQATGLERKELEALMQGKEDPFNMSVQEGPWGTRENPVLVPSRYEERIVGCICDDDQNYIMWHMVKKGEEHRCECGHYYKLVDANPTKIDNM